MDSFLGLFSTDGFMPHGHCYLWQPEILWSMFSADLLIGFSYIGIALLLFRLVKKSQVPFSGIFLVFGVFIGSCGAVHLVEVWTIWNPSYHLEASMKVITAASSMVACVWLALLGPKITKLVESARSAERNRIQLRESNAQLETTNKELANQRSEIAQLYERMQTIDQLKTQFFANVSHEFRTPLTLILGPTEKLLQNSEKPQDIQRDIEVIHRNARILLKHVNSLLDFAKIDSGNEKARYEEVDVAKLLRLSSAHFEAIARDRSIDFTVESPSRLVAELDPYMFQNIMLNLIGNAFKFSAAQHGRISVRLVDLDQYFRVEIEDDGPGVPDHLREQIFERFRQADEGVTRRFTGTGLGLAIAKELTELHHGNIGVEAGAMNGALFWIKFPTRAPKDSLVNRYEEQKESDGLSGLVAELEQIEQDQAPSQTPRNYETSQGTVLVVEDNNDMREYLAGILSKNYAVISARNGREGFQKATIVRPDIILSDIMMPEMSGDQMIDEIRKIPELNHIPVIFLTAKLDDQLKEKVLREGVHDYLVKPFFSEEILSRVQNLMTLKKTKDLLERQLNTKSNDLEQLADEISKKNIALANALRSRDEFLSIASHELKTPITSLKLQLQIMDRRVKPEGELPPVKDLVKAFRMSLKQVDSLTALIDDLLDVSKIRLGRMSYKFEEFKLGDIAREVADRFSNHLTNARIPLSLEIDNSITGIWDKHRIEQVFVNLISNVIKYAPGEPAKLSIYLKDGQAVISVSDNGSGIPKEKQDSIFERFERASTSSISGLGLGLFIVKTIVQAHSGKIVLDSELGKGSTFTVYLPLIAEDHNKERDSHATIS